MLWKCFNSTPTLCTDRKCDVWDRSALCPPAKSTDINRSFGQRSLASYRPRVNLLSATIGCHCIRSGDDDKLIFSNSDEHHPAPLWNLWRTGVSTIVNVMRLTYWGVGLYVQVHVLHFCYAISLWSYSQSGWSICVFCLLLWNFCKEFVERRRRMSVLMWNV